MEYDDFVPDSDDDEYDSEGWERQAPQASMRDANGQTHVLPEQARRDDDDDDVHSARDPAQSISMTSMLQSPSSVMRTRALHTPASPLAHAAKRAISSEPQQPLQQQQHSREAGHGNIVDQTALPVQAAEPKVATSSARAQTLANEHDAIQQDTDTHRDGTRSYHTDITQSASDSDNRVIQVGDLVEVESRTWPGINKPGGSGRVAAVHRETSATGATQLFYDVRYVLGGFEKRIEREYVELSHILELARAQNRVRYERVFYHDEFAASMHRKKRLPYDTDTSSSGATALTSGLLGDSTSASASASVEPAKRRKRSSRRRSNGSSDASTARRRIDRSSNEQSASMASAIARSASSSSDSQDSDDAWEHAHVIRRIDDRTFVMDVSTRSTSPDKEQRPQQQTSSLDAALSSDTTRRRRQRIIESDDSDSDNGDAVRNRSSSAESDHAPLQQQQQQQRSVSDAHQTSSIHHRHRHHHHVRPTKKRRFVGGYLHSGDDADATFIQPEDNANALPDDVARELAFTLGKSKTELRAQLATIASALTTDLRAFEDARAALTRTSKRALGLSADELKGVYYEALELERMLTQRLIRGGEDVMNAVIVKLTNKGGRLPDSVELVFDDQKRAISDHGVWVRKALASLETACKARGVALPSDDAPLASTELSDDSSTAHGAYDYDDVDIDTQTMRRYDSSSNSHSSRLSTSNRQSQRSSSNDSRRHTAYRHSRKRARTVDAFIASHTTARGDHQLQQQHQSFRLTTSTTLDDFDFIQYGSTQQRDAFTAADDFRSTPYGSYNSDDEVAPRASNVRLPGRTRPMAPSDPRWSWFQMGKRKEQARMLQRQTLPGVTAASSAAESFGSIAPQRTNKRMLQEQLLGHVQSARLQLRKQRIQRARGAGASAFGDVYSVARAYGQGYDPPAPPSGGSSSNSSNSSRVIAASLAAAQRLPPTVATRFATAYTGHAPLTVGNNSAGHVSVSSAAAEATEAQVDWANVFDILADDSDDDAVLPITPESRALLVTRGLAHCSSNRHVSATDSDDDNDDNDSDTSAAIDDLRDAALIKRRATRLRQALTALRFQECEFMDSLPGVATRAGAVDSASFTDSVAWRDLVAAGDRYDAALRQFARYALVAVHDCVQLHTAAGATTTTGVIALVRSVAVEVEQTLAQLPDCDALFDSCRAYVFFFEVADRDSRTTPLVTALARTYWRSIELLVDLKATASADSAALARTVEATVERVVPTNRAVLAAALFLVDLYLYLPSSHRVDSSALADANDARMHAPALALWLVLYDCFVTGKCSFQLGKRLASGDGRDFWALLQTLYRDHFVDHLAVAFVQSRSSGGYLVDCVPKLSAAPADAEDVAHGQLLAIQSIWRLSLLFTQLLPAPLDASSHDDATSEARWAVARDLLQPGKRAFLPFSESQSTTELSVYASIYKLHVLQHVIAFSKVSSPQSDMIERLLEELWDDSASGDEKQRDDRIELSPFWVALLLRAAAPGGLNAFVNEWTADAADRVDLLSVIILIQILKFEKPIHRSRFRQPICRAIAARLEATKPNVEVVAVASAPVATPVVAAGAVGHAKPAPGKPVAWNWGSSSSAAVAGATASAPTRTAEPARKPIQRGPDEERLMVSILLALAVSSICSDNATPPTTLRAPTQRANKPLKRDLEFYYKEMARIVHGRIELSVLLSQALYVMGCVAIAHSNEYATVFAFLNEHVTSTAQRLRTLRKSHSDRDGAPSAAMKHENRLLQRSVMSSLFLLRDLTQRLCALIPSVPDTTATLPLSSAPTSSSYALDAVRASLSSVLNTGLEGCLDAAVDALLPLDALTVVLEIVHTLLPRALDAPVRCLQVAAVYAGARATITAPLAPRGEFDEFDDLYADDDVWASVDLDTCTASSSGGASTTAAASSLVPPATLATFDATVRQAALTHLRLALQRAVIKYPPHAIATFHELYVVELLGALVATCSVPFAWSLVAGSALKPRMLAPRLLSAVLKHDDVDNAGTKTSSSSAKDWFTTCFLSESGADQELAALWLMATLDLRALVAAPCMLEPTACGRRFGFPVGGSPQATDEQRQQISYTNYWFVLTDAVVYNTLRVNAVAQYKMDPLLLQLLRATAQQCAFIPAMQQQQSQHASSEPPSDLRTLYALHLDVFQAFCRCAGSLWHALAADAAAHRADMHRFRLKMMDVQTGVFATFPEAFEINLRVVCQDLDRSRCNWYARSEQFVQDFAAVPSSSGSTTTATLPSPTDWHTVDESLELAMPSAMRDDADVRVLIVLFRFMYGCVDAFLCHCGAMAIGQHNLFVAILQLMFRQASCAEFPQAEKRLMQQFELQHGSSSSTDAHPQSKWLDAATSVDSASSGSQHRPVQASRPQKLAVLGGAKAVSPACLGFVESVRLFFARQKYPSLLHWFAQTLETYQTVKRGWRTSPLRKLLLNVLDPHGPLGVHSYYPIEVNASAGGRAFDVHHVRREAFYLSCGLFVCRCTTAYEHTRRDATDSDAVDARLRLRTLRTFILNDFVEETLAYAAGDSVVLHETLVPLAQFVRAVVSHANLNVAHQSTTQSSTAERSTPSTNDLDFAPTEVSYCVERLLLYCVKTFSATAVLQSSISCVLALELCGIVSEIVTLHDALYDSRVSTLLELALAYFCDVFTALGETSANALERVFAVTGDHDPPSRGGLPTTRELLATFQPMSSSHSIDAVKIERAAQSPDSTASSAAVDEYGISRLRVRADLVVSITRLAERCKRSCDARLRRFVKVNDNDLVAVAAATSVR